MRQQSLILALLSASTIILSTYPVMAQGDDDSPLIGAEDLGLEFDLTNNPVDEEDEVEAQEDEFVARNDDGTGTVKYYRTKTPIIPEGATENNEMGFYLQAEYATVVNEYKEVSFELNLTLHHKKKQQHNEVYMFWVQAIDTALIAEAVKRLDYDTEYYEGFVCAIRYDEGEDKKFYAKIRPQYLYRMGYVGTTALQYAKGSYEKLLRLDQTDKYPWLLNEPKYTDEDDESKRSTGRINFDLTTEETGKTYMTMIDDYEVYSETCSMYRDFETTYSEIPMKAGSPFKLNIGYKVYAHHEDRTPLYKGHKLDIEWIMRGEEELAISSLGQVGALLVSTLFLAIF